MPARCVSATACSARRQTNVINVASGAELQYSGNLGSKFNDPIQGGGDFNLVGGTVQLTGTNTYTGGTDIQIGATLDVTTANLPTGGAISNAGGNLLFDQTASGTFSGVMSDGKQAGGPTDPNDVACTVIGITCGSSVTLSGTLIRDDSTADGSNINTSTLALLNSTYVNNNVIVSNVQDYSGATYIEAGALTLGRGQYDRYKQRRYTRPRGWRGHGGLGLGCQ